jgi:hypothetical protein
MDADPLASRGSALCRWLKVLATPAVLRPPEITCGVRWRVVASLWLRSRTARARVDGQAALGGYPPSALHETIITAQPMLSGRSLMALQSHWSHRAQDAGERIFFWLAIISTIVVAVLYMIYTSP